MNIIVKNTSHDTVYAISQSNSIYNWDSCFAYEFIKSDRSENVFSLNMSSWNFVVSHGPYNSSNYILIPPDSTFAFGSRSNKEITASKLYLSMYVIAIHVNDTDKITEIKTWQTTKRKIKRIRPWKARRLMRREPVLEPVWEWRSIPVNEEK